MLYGTVSRYMFLFHLSYRAYYSPEGLEYNLGRVPIGGTDFSTHPYTYDDLSEGEDPALHHFSLTSEDIKYKVR